MHSLPRGTDHSPACSPPAAIPALRARDCPEKEKEALNYLFLLVPLINITLPLVWKSFAAVYTADVTVFLSMYAWKVRVYLVYILLCIQGRL